MRVRLENVRAKIVDATMDERLWLHSYLSFRDPSAFFAGNKKKKWHNTGRVYLVDRRSWTFPAGLVPMAVRAAQREHDKASVHGASDVSPIIVEEARTRTVEWDWNADLEWLRDYQFDAVWTAYEQGRGLIKAPTAAGKGEIMWALVKALPCHWGVLVHRSSLMRELAKRYEKRTGEQPGIIGDGEWRPDPNKRATFATFQTLSRALAKKDPRAKLALTGFEAILVDEAHTLPAKTFYKVGMACSRAFYRIGLSGTPLDRHDNKSMYAIAVLGEIIVNLHTPDLISQGFLSKPTIRMIPIWQESWAGNWKLAYDRCIVKSEERNALLLDMVRAADKPALVFVSRLKHGTMLNEVLNRYGIRSSFMWGAKSTGVREKAIKDLRYGDLDVIVCNEVFQEGADIPELRAVINGAGRKTTIGAIQRIGRGMRIDKASGKTTFEVWDVFDQGDRFMEEHAKHRIRAYKKEGHAVQIEPDADRWRAGVRAMIQQPLI